MPSRQRPAESKVANRGRFRLTDCTEYQLIRKKENNSRHDRVVTPNSNMFLASIICSLDSLTVGPSRRGLGTIVRSAWTLANPNPYPGLQVTSWSRFVPAISSYLQTSPFCWRRWQTMIHSALHNGHDTSPPRVQTPQRAKRDPSLKGEIKDSCSHHRDG